MELNLKFDKSMTIATLKDLITGSEGYDEELTKNLHTTIVEDWKSNEQRIHIEKREEKLRIEKLRKDEFELEKLRIQAQSNLGAVTSEGSNTKFFVKVVSKFIHHFDLKEDISLYLKLFEQKVQRLDISQEHWLDRRFKGRYFQKLADLVITDQLKRKTPYEFKEYYLDKWPNMNSPVQLAEEEFEDVKRSLKQKSSNPFVKKQEFKPMEKNSQV
ncbi:uncharacterized protein TNCT_170351 [Trichonephila clavata]|uniref:Uncharacterized protein n=1 Tax=Trichonephila clavata TaxID=2740835 RepID=A0A8X6GD94_TRICU|nr:uncharacterized protein TNCT_170351 [Trichonephila clavata]